MKQEGHDPGGQGRDEDDDKRVAHTLKATTEVELREVDAARDEREARDDEEHRADIAGLMDRREAEQQLGEPKKNRIGQASSRDRDRHVHEERVVMPDQLAADRVADACATEGEQHLRQTAAQQEGESATREGRRETELRWTVEGMDVLDLIELRVKLCTGPVDALRREIHDEMLETIELRGIDARVREAERLRHALLAVEAVIRERHETNVYSAGHPELSRQRVHRAPYSPRTGAAGQKLEPAATDDGRLLDQARLCDGDVRVIRGVLHPVHLHMIL